MKRPFKELMHMHNYIITTLDIVYHRILCSYMCITSTVQPAGLTMILQERPCENISEFKDFK